MAVTKVAAIPNRTPALAAKEILAHIAGGFPAGVKGNPSTAVQAAQRDMGGLTVDGLWGPKTKARAELLAGGKAPVTTANAQKLAIQVLAQKRTPKQAALDLQKYINTPNINKGVKGRPAAAVQAAQRDMGMPTRERDGIFGPVTSAAMNSLLFVGSAGAPAPLVRPSVPLATATTPTRVGPQTSAASTPRAVLAPVSTLLPEIPSATKQAALTELQNFVNSGTSTQETFSSTTTNTNTSTVAPMSPETVFGLTGGNKDFMAQTVSPATTPDIAANHTATTNPINKYLLWGGVAAAGATLLLVATKKPKRRGYRQ